MSPEVTVRGCKKCCIFSAVGGTDAMLWSGSVVNIRSECEEDEGADCEVGDSDTGL